jgi:hypothetical protein
MATRRQVRPKRVAELEAELSKVTDRARSDKKSRAILSVLEDLRKQGVQRSQYNLASPYGQGISHRPHEVQHDLEVADSPD